jgi:hypothetical protein
LYCSRPRLQVLVSNWRFHFTSLSSSWFKLGLNSAIKLPVIWVRRERRGRRRFSLSLWNTSLPEECFVVFALFRIKFHNALSTTWTWIKVLVLVVSLVVLILFGRRCMWRLGRTHSSENRYVNYKCMIADLHHNLRMGHCACGVLFWSDRPQSQMIDCTVIVPQSTDRNKKV